jgi:uncharacterized membrane protein
LNWIAQLNTMSKPSKALFIFLAVAILVTTGFIIYMTVTPQKAEKFTEFYILNAEGKAADYPEKVVVGNPVDIIIGVINHEYQPVDYKVDIQIDSTEVGKTNTGTLAYQQKWEDEVSFVPRVVGEKQKVDFILFKNDETEPYLKEPLTLYIDVVSQ